MLNTNKQNYDHSLYATNYRTASTTLSPYSWVWRRLRIGQARKFDYSSSQAIKTLKEENIRTVLINPNIATAQTDEHLADEVYLQPLNFETTEQIIRKEKPDALLLGFGGQTALNLGLQLEEAGVLLQHGMQVLGTIIASIRQSEDRDQFKA